jgi:hypothetical protein
MLRKDGCYVIYIIETRSKSYKDGKWFTANLDYFGHPEDFSAPNACWQETGIEGTFDVKKGLKGLKWMKKRHPGKEFRLTAVHITQMKVPVADDSSVSSKRKLVHVSNRSVLRG